MIWLELNAKIPPFDNVKVRQAMNFAFPQRARSSRRSTRASPIRSTAHAQHLPGLRRQISSTTATISTRPRRCSKRPASATASRRRSPTTPAIPCRSRSRSSTNVAAQDRRRARAEEGAGRRRSTNRHQAQAADDLLRRQPVVPGSRLFADLYFHTKSYRELQQLRQRRGRQAARRDGGHSRRTTVASRNMTKQAQKIMMDEAPWVFVAYPNYTMARKADLKGWTYYTSNNIRFQDFTPRPERSLTGAGNGPECGHNDLGAAARGRAPGKLTFFLAVLTGAAAVRPRLRASCVVGHRARDLRAAGSRRSSRTRPIRPPSSCRPSWPHIMGTDAIGMDYFQPRDLRAAHRSDDRRRRHAALGRDRLAARRARRLLRGPARLRHLLLPAASCALPTCCRPFPSSSSPSPLVASARPEPAQHRARHRLRQHPDLSPADAQPGAVDPAACAMSRPPTSPAPRICGS